MCVDLYEKLARLLCKRAMDRRHCVGSLWSKTVSIYDRICNIYRVKKGKYDDVNDILASF